MGGKCCQCGPCKNELNDEESEIKKENDPRYKTQDELNELRKLQMQKGLFEDADGLIGKDKLKTLKNMYGTMDKKEIIIEENDGIEKYEKPKLNAAKEKVKHDPPFWNEKTMDNIEDEIFDLNEEKSEKIFQFFNDIRLNPENYINQSNDENISDLLKKADKNEYKPNTLIKNNSFFYQMREGLMNIYSTPKSDESLMEDIENLCFKDFELKKRYFVECPIDEEEEAIWNLLKKYENVALDELLTNNVSYCVICALPIKDSYNMKVYFLMLTEKINV